MQFSMPQPQGSFYVINTSAELSSVPAGQMLNAAYCPNENLMYIKSTQNGQPTYLTFQVTPYTPPRPEDLTQEVMAALKKVNERLDRLEQKGGSINELL